MAMLINTKVCTGIWGNFELDKINVQNKFPILATYTSSCFQGFLTEDLNDLSTCVRY